jgi:multicopper oxidase
MPQGVTVHWHGIALVNDMDGVPDLTQAAVPNGQKFTYDFVVPDAGTYWFHSHVGTQLDRGLYGPLIIEDPDEKVDYDDELVLVLDDWIDGTGTNPDQVFENLRKTGMKPMAPGGPGVTPTSPLGADGGDVEYPYFVINGRVPAYPQVVDYRAGQRIRLRVINAGSDSAFRVAVPNTTMKVIQTDGYPVMPLQANSVILGMGERADAIVTVNESLPVVAVPEGKQGHAQLNMRVNNAPSAVNVDAFVASVRREAPLDTATLSPTPEVTLPAKASDQLIEARLTGPVNGYTWPVNGKLYNPPKRRSAGEAEPAGPDPLHQRVDDVPPVPPTRSHVPGDEQQRSQGPQGHRAGATQADRGGRLRHEQSRSVDQPLPQHLPPRGGNGVLCSVRGLRATSAALAT